MRHLQRALYVVAFGAVSLLVIGMAPAVVLVGEAVNRHYLKGLRAQPERVAPWRPRCQPRAPRWRWLAGDSGSDLVDVSFATRHHRLGWLASLFLANPVWIALTAPAWWIMAVTRRRIKPNGGGRGGSPFAGVREPRRPKPTQPAGAIALPEPRWPEL